MSGLRVSHEPACSMELRESKPRNEISETESFQIATPFFMIYHIGGQAAGSFLYIWLMILGIHHNGVRHGDATTGMLRVILYGLRIFNVSEFKFCSIILRSFCSIPFSMSYL